MAQLLNRIGQLGLGVAIVGGVVNSALYNGELKTIESPSCFYQIRPF
jgi:hypothetical protein